MQKTLVILAAGIGSRFGGGIKQLEPVDDHGLRQGLLKSFLLSVMTLKRIFVK